MRSLASAVLFLFGLACTRVHETPEPKPKPSGATGAGIVNPEPASAAKPKEEPREFALFLESPALLVALEKAGLSFEARVDPGLDDGALLPLPVRKIIEADLSELEGKDPLLGTSIARHSHRLFPKRYLGKPSGARVLLSAVVARVDRLDFAPSTCGELRLVYRLVYDDSEKRASRLPATFILEYEVPRESDCRAFLESLRVDDDSDPEALGRLLTSEKGPFALHRFELSGLKQLALNMQVVRWPAAVRPDLGGHAEYLLRAFRWDPSSASFIEGLLENTPDPVKIALKPELARELRELLDAPETRRAVERGNFLLPERFLAKRAFSFSPRGLSRAANRPFSSLFANAKKDGSTKGSLSEASFLRRLDQMSCQGCHQTRSLAGFHFLGVESPEVPPGAGLFVSASPHLLGDFVRRTAFADRVARNEVVNDAIPFADQGHSDAGFAEPCGLGDPAYSGFSCAIGYRCEAVDLPLPQLNSVGVCLPEKAEVGEPCEAGPLNGALDPHKDRLASRVSRECGTDQYCNRSAVGFPAGMCTAACDSDEPQVRCGPVAVLDPFNACLARREPFTDCLEKHTRPSGLRSCSADASCRDDYACAKVASGGVCVPPYFLLELRVDGHP